MSSLNIDLAVKAKSPTSIIAGKPAAGIVDRELAAEYQVLFLVYNYLLTYCIDWSLKSVTINNSPNGSPITLKGPFAFNLNVIANSSHMQLCDSDVR